MKLHFTRHFEERWVERVGPRRPTRAEAEAIIRESIQIQQYRDVYTPRGRRITILASYWHPGRGLVIKGARSGRDGKTGLQLVTVLTADGGQA